VFKHDRSVFYVCSWDEPANLDRWLTYVYDTEELPLYIAKLEDWLIHEEVEFI